MNTFPQASLEPSDLVERPSDVLATTAETTEELLENFLADINVVCDTAHALVSDGGGGSLAVGRDGDGLATEDVTVGLSAHQHVRESHNVVRVVLATVILTTSAHADSVVGDITAV